MPDSVEENVLKVLEGLPLEGVEAEICDYSLQEQNEALESQGIQSLIDPNYKPVVQDTVTYIVACILINEHGEVLMMQEAKKTCSGKWYLPAGRIEKGETITEAGKREVLEETGLEVNCTTLLLVESAGGAWIRFVLTGKVVGGTLKTPAQADGESLQAQWVKNIEELELRATDIIHLIDRAREYVDARRKKDIFWHHDQLPALRAYSQVLLRLVVLIKKKSTNRVHILLSEKTSWHLPTCEVNPQKSFHSTLRRFMVDLFGAEVPAHKPHGLLSVEHDPRTDKDGVCLTLLVAFRAPLEEVPIIGKCVWHEVSKELGDKLLRRADVYAILAVTWEEKIRNETGKRLRICSDSQAALKALCKPTMSAGLVQECADALQELAGVREVELVWVLGHMEVPGNEKADELARGGSRQKCAPEPFL